MSEFTNPRHSGTYHAMGKWGELTEGQTLSCCHCQFTAILQKGSGRSWGFCVNCMGYHCLKAECIPCINFERRIENIEAGKPELTPAPAMILVPQSIDGLK